MSEKAEQEPTRFDALIEKAATYQELAKENYDRVRRIAEGIRAGFCAYLGSRDGICVRLVPPAGPFQPSEYGDKAFSIPPRGFRHIGPIAFGLAVRVTHGTDWLRMMVVCVKQGEHFNVSISDGPSADFDLPFGEDDHQEFYELLFNHVLSWLDDRINFYQDGAYGAKRSIGFDFSDENTLGDGLHPSPDIVRPHHPGILETASEDLAAEAAQSKDDS